MFEILLIAIGVSPLALYVAIICRKHQGLFWWTYSKMLRESIVIGIFMAIFGMLMMEYANALTHFMWIGDPDPPLRTLTMMNRIIMDGLGAVLCTVGWAGLMWFITSIMVLFDNPNAIRSRF